MRVLLVDDEPELVFTVAERLELRGFEVDAVTSGEEALKLVAGKEFDVLVVDVKMPGMGGGEVLASVRESHPWLPVILLTGHGGEEEADNGLLSRCCAYLYKPVKIEELIETMTTCVEGRGDA